MQMSDFEILYLVLIIISLVVTVFVATKKITAPRQGMRLFL